MGEIAIKPKFDFMYEQEVFRDGLARVKEGGKWDYIDKNENMAIRPQFDKASSFAAGFARVAVGVPVPERFLADNGKMGVIDKCGRFVVRPDFEEATPFEDGVALVRVGPKWGYIDRSGTFIITP